MNTNRKEKWGKRHTEIEKEREEIKNGDAAL